MLQDIKIIIEESIFNMQMEFFIAFAVWCIKLLEN